MAGVPSPYQSPGWPQSPKPVKSAAEEGLEEIKVNVQRLPEPYFVESLTVSRPRFPWSAIILLGVGALLMMRGNARRRGR